MAKVVFTLGNTSKWVGGISASGLLLSVLALPLQTVAYAADQTTQQPSANQTSQPPQDAKDYEAWKAGLAPAAQPSTASPHALSPNLVIEGGLVTNDYLSFKVLNAPGNEDNGRFTVGTTGGDPENPNDDHQVLLYGHPDPWSSFTTIQMDGNNVIYNPEQEYPTSDGATDSNTSVMSLGNGVTVKQVLTFVENPATLRKDTVQVKYIVTNDDSVAHSIGTRIMMDTMLGNNDGAPFRVPGVGAVTHELELDGDQIPEYWQAFDDLNNPHIISQGTLYSSQDTRPDKVQWAYWGDIYYSMWDYQVDPNRWVTDDSAVAMYWNPSSLAPGASKQFVTYYGLSDLSQDLAPPLSLSVTGASALDVHNGAYDPNPFTVTAYIQNISGVDAHNVHASLNLPDGLHLVPGQSADDSIGNMTVNQQQQVSWQVEADPASQPKQLQYSVTVGADNTQDKTVSRGISIPALQTSTDTTAPDTQMQTNPGDNGNGWYNSDVQVSFQASDEQGGSGVNHTEYSLDNGATWQTYNDPFTVSDEGTTKFLYRSVDNAGNVETAKTAVIRIDKSIPDFKFGINPDTKALVIMGTDTGSGLPVSEYDITSTLTNADKTFTFTDNAGNQVELDATVSHSATGVAITVDAVKYNGTPVALGSANTELRVTWQQNGAAITSMDQMESVNGAMIWDRYQANTGKTVVTKISSSGAFSFSTVNGMPMLWISSNHGTFSYYNN